MKQFVLVNSAANYGLINMIYKKLKNCDYYDYCGYRYRSIRDWKTGIIEIERVPLYWCSAIEPPADHWKAMAFYRE